MRPRTSTARLRTALLCRWVAPLAVLAAGLALGGRPAMAEGSLHVDKTGHDFGVVSQRAELEAVFTLTNTGTATVRNITVRPDCGCYGLALSDAVLGTGEKATLRVKFRTLNMVGTHTKHARLSYDDGTVHHVKLGLTVRIESGLILDPGRVYFGEFLAGKRPQKSVKLLYREGRGKSFRVLRVTPPAGEFAAVVPIPFTDPHDAKWKGWALSFRFVKAPPMGIYSKVAVVETDHPDHPRIEVSLTGNVVGKVWVQRPVLSAGFVPAGEKRVLTTLVRPTRGAQVKLGKVRLKTRRGVWQVSIAPIPGRPDHYTLTAVVPADAPVGKLDDEIEIHADVPGEPVTKVKLLGRVYRKRG